LIHRLTKVEELTKAVELPYMQFQDYLAKNTTELLQVAELRVLNQSN
jgi:hypothetical protein